MENCMMAVNEQTLKLHDTQMLKRKYFETYSFVFLQDLFQTEISSARPELLNKVLRCIMRIRIFKHRYNSHFRVCTCGRNYRDMQIRVCRMRSF